MILASTQRIPHEQRRGAIIILGMMGIAKPREVLTDRVEVMLKVGLGKLGKVSWIHCTRELRLILHHRATLPLLAILVLPSNVSTGVRRRSKVCFPFTVNSFPTSLLKRLTGG